MLPQSTFHVRKVNPTKRGLVTITGGLLSPAILQEVLNEMTNS